MNCRGGSSLRRAALVAALLIPGLARAANLPYGFGWKLDATTLSAPLGSSWTVTQLNDVALCPDGNIVVTGNSSTSGGASGAYLAKISATGSVLWALNATTLVGYAVTAAPDGSVFVGGGSGSTQFLASYDASGNLRWTATLGGNLTPKGLAMDTGGNLLVVGLTTFLTKYSGATGAYINGWGGPATTTARAVAVDGSGNVFVASSNNSCGYNYISRYPEPTYASPVHTALNTVASGCPEFNDIVVSASGLVYGLSGVDVTQNNQNSNGTLIAIVNGAGALVGEYRPGIPTSVGTTAAPSGNISMTTGTVLPSGLVVAAWQQNSSAGVTAGTPASGCGGGGCFEGAWAASLGTSLIARRMLATGKWLYVVGDSGDGGSGPDNTRYLVAGLGDSGSKLPAEGKLEVRNNVIRTNQGERSVIVLKGTPGANVELAVYGPSGALVGVYDDVISLDGSGVGSVTFDGTTNGNGGFKLGTGVYWIVARDGVNDRKPVMVIGDAQGGENTSTGSPTP